MIAKCEEERSDEGMHTYMMDNTDSFVVQFS